MSDSYEIDRRVQGTPVTIKGQAVEHDADSALHILGGLTMENLRKAAEREPLEMIRYAIFQWTSAAVSADTKYGKGGILAETYWRIAQVWAEAGDRRFGVTLLTNESETMATHLSPAP